MSNIHLRGLDKTLIQKLKSTAAEQEISVNTLILTLIKQGIGLGVKTKKRIIYHDLDDLAGTWTASESKAFMKSIEDLENIDEDLWK